MNHLHCLINVALQLHGKSWVTQLLPAVDIIYFFDLAKAFELVPHTCLLTRLESYGLT